MLVDEHNKFESISLFGGVEDYAVVELGEIVKKSQEGCFARHIDSLGRAEDNGQHFAQIAKDTLCLSFASKEVNDAVVIEIM